MPINFFKEGCQDTTQAELFGIYDDPQLPNDPAYILHYQPPVWIAIVQNNNRYEVLFTAIDNCVEVRRPNGTMDSRCDGMLTYNGHIVFVELKERMERNKDWVPDGANQLRITINYFSNNHDINQFESKRAFLANNRKPYFQVGQQSLMDRFEDETGVRLLVQNLIVL